MQRATYTPRGSARARTTRDVLGEPIKLEAPTAAPAYPHRLSLYEKPPAADTELTLEEFEAWAVDRMTVLDELDNLAARPFAEVQREMRVVLNRCLPLSRGDGSSGAVAHERFKDQMSHFVLRLAFCQRPEDRARFVRLETLLFRLRYEMATLDERAAFVAGLQLGWARVTPAELKRLEPQLQFAGGGGGVAGGVYYKVPMEDAMDLVRRRRVVLVRGLAYVPEALQYSMLAREFARGLGAALETLARYRARFKDDARIEPVLRIASSGFAKSQAFRADPARLAGAGAKFTAQSLGELDAANCLPMCASMLHTNLQKTRHAFHGERLQLQRFLKFMGMPVEEAVRLYTSCYNDDRKRNELTYGVKHVYGLVGSRKEYPPASCRRVYEDGLNARANEVHGCPFQRLAPENLERLLRQHGIADADGIAEVQRHARERQIHLACTKTYELAHPGDRTKYDGAISSPNMYFERAWDYRQQQQQQQQQQGVRSS